MKKFSSTMVWISLFIGFAVWGCFFLFQAHPSLLIDENAREMTERLRKQFVFVRNLFWGMGILSFSGMVSGILGLCLQKRDRNLSSLLIFALTFTGCFLSGSFAFLMIYTAFWG
jgi:hypothetical protein